MEELNNVSFECDQGELTITEYNDGSTCVYVENGDGDFIDIDVTQHGAFNKLIDATVNPIAYRYRSIAAW